MIELREGSAADRDAILALRARCFADEDPDKQDPRFWEWEFARGRCFVAADGERVVAHLGFMPQAHVPLLAVDAMTDPEYRRQHLFSRVVELARDALRESVHVSGAFQIRDAVLPAMVRGGWRPVVRAPVLVRPLLMKRLLRSSAGGSPAVAGAASRRPAAGVTAGKLPALHGRDPGFFRWRFLENPLWQYDIEADDDAYIVTRRTVLRGLDTLAVADFAWRAGSEHRAKALLRQVLARGRAEGADVAAALTTLAHPALPLLVRSGFLPSPHRFRFLVNVFRDEDRPRIARARWPLMWADTDHL